MPSRWINHYSSRSIYGAMDLFSEPEIKECVAWLLPKWAYYVARSFLVDYGLRETSYWVEKSTDIYLTPSVSQLDTIYAVIADALEGEVTCATDIISAIDGITSAINTATENACCEGGGAGGSGQSDGPASENEDNGTDDPTGGLYSDYEDYKQNKCGWAEKIINDLLDDLTEVQTAVLGTWTGVLLAAAFVTPIPFDEILVMIGVGLAFVVSGTIAAFATAIKTEITDNESDIKCDLYESLDVGQAGLAFSSNMSLSFLQESFLSSMLTNDSLNRLFTKQAEIGGGDCSGCGGDCWCGIELLAAGVHLGGISFASTDVGFGFGLDLTVNMVGTDVCNDFCGPAGQAIVTNLVGYTSTPSTTGFQVLTYADCNNPITIYSDDVDVWGAELVGRRFQIWSSTPFTLDIEGC